MLNSLYVTASFTTITMIAAVVYYAFRLAEDARAQTEALLRNILPDSIVDRLTDKPDAVIADSFEEASVLFADLKGFVPLAKTLGPERTVGLLNEMMRSFDRLAAMHGVEKIKTIGDAYMVAAGVPEPVRRSCAETGADGPRHAAGDRGAGQGVRCAAASAHRHRLGARHGRRHRRQAPHLRRVGRYGEPRLAAGRAKHAGRVLVAKATKARLDGLFQLEPRGALDIKGLGEVEAWFLGPEEVSDRRERRATMREHRYTRSPRSSFGTSPVRPAASATKQLLQGRHALDQPEAEVAGGAQHREVVGEQPVERVEGGRRQRRVEPAPALVALERGERADVEAEPGRIGDHLGQRRHVAQAEVEALAGDRVHAVRRVADEREAVGHQRARQMHVERPGGARAGQLDGAQAIAEALLAPRRGSPHRRAPRSRAPALASSVQVMHERLPVSGRMANGPAGRKCCTARPRCGFSWRTVVTMPTWG